jgi:RNA polymerase sigma factor (sigma-70 family)
VAGTTHLWRVTSTHRPDPAPVPGTILGQAPIEPGEPSRTGPDLRTYAPVVAASAQSAAEHTLTQLTAAALDGDVEALNALCLRLSNVAWKVLNNIALLGHHDREDAYTGTFFRLVQKLDTIREPEKLPGWVAMTALNEARTLLRARKRVDPMGDVPESDGPLVEHEDPAEGLLRDELRTAIRAGFARIPENCQRLLRALTADPPLSYDQIGEQLDLKRGTIGPARRRCLDRLQRTREVATFLGSVP